MSVTYRIGGYRITRIAETSEPAVLPDRFFPELPREVLDADAGWAHPAFYDRDADKVVLSTHSWLIRGPNRTILFELGAGNGKERPNFPRAHRLDTSWLDNLLAAGVTPDRIDLLFPSHLHVDHVGWFTSFRDGAWRPTFPNARAVIARAEMDNWTSGRRPLPFPAFNEGVLEDSVFPLRDLGLLDLAEDGHVLDEGLTLQSMPGHTFGHTGMVLDLGAEGAVFCGDTMYSPLQLVHPDLNAYADEAPEQCRATRHRVLGLCADRGFLLFPSHFPDPFAAVRVFRDNGGFRFEPAAAQQEA